MASEAGKPESRMVGVKPVPALSVIPFAAGNLDITGTGALVLYATPRLIGIKDLGLKLQVIFGHRSPLVTEVYAEMYQQKAMQAIVIVG